MNLLAMVLTQVEEEHEFEAHNPLLPETLEIIWGGLAALIVFALLWKFALPAIKNMLQARSDRIQRELDNAARAETEAEAQAVDIRSKLGNIDAEQSRVLADADVNAERLLTEGRARLDQEAADLQVRAEAEIAVAGGRVASELQAEVSELASEAAETIVARQLDDAALQRLVEDYISNVGNGGRA